jgi:phasin family protein
MSQKTPFDLLQEMDLNKIFSGMNMPAMNVDGLLESQRKNLETFAAANKVAVESAQALARRQTEMLRESVESMTSAAQGLTDVRDPEQFNEKQAALARDAYEQALQNLHELGEMMSGANKQAFELINQRMNEIMAELQEMAAKAQS